MHRHLLASLGRNIGRGLSRYPRVGIAGFIGIFVAGAIGLGYHWWFVGRPSQAAIWSLDGTVCQLPERGGTLTIGLQPRVTYTTNSDGYTQRQVDRSNPEVNLRLINVESVGHPWAWLADHDGRAQFKEGWFNRDQRHLIHPTREPERTAVNTNWNSGYEDDGPESPLGAELRLSRRQGDGWDHALLQLNGFGERNLHMWADTEKPTRGPRAGSWLSQVREPYPVPANARSWPCD